MKSPELVIPAGDFEKLEFALEFGADAVYLGVPRYSLRARENGFNRELLLKAIEYTHQLNRKVFVTANVFPHNHKLDSMLIYLDELLAECQPDAWIMSDPGLITIFKEHHPEQIIHLSVQANTVNYASAEFWGKIGVRRIILSRELSLPEISRIKDHCPEIEIEVFIHGSICVAYSGRCLISNYLTHRDSNLGSCANSCRWEYKIYKKEACQPDEQYTPLKNDYYIEEVERPGEFIRIDEDEHGAYLMNARDLCAILYLKDLHQAGVDAFKVEGRSKSVYYAAHITRAYRLAIDDLSSGQPLTPERYQNYYQDIFATSNRGFTTGFLKGNPGASAIKFDSASSEQPCYRFAAIVRGYDDKRKLIKIEPRNRIWQGINLELVTKDKTLPLSIDKIYDEHYQELTLVHGGVINYYWIPCPINPGKFALLREKIREFEVQPKAM
jgi:U32 family peptidase